MRSSAFVGVVALFAATLSACTEENPRFWRVDAGAASESNLPDAGLATDTGGEHDGLQIEPDVAQDARTPSPDTQSADTATSLPDVTPDLAMPSATSVALRAGLIGYWRFDEPDDAIIVRDSSGLNHHGRIEGNTNGAGFVNGRFGRAYSISQNNEDFGIRVEATAAINAIKRYTLAAWVYRSATKADYTTIISRQLNDTLAEVFDLAIAFDVPKIYGWDRLPTGEVTLARSNSPAPLGVWFHVAGTFDGKRLAIFVNGVLTGEIPFAKPLPSTNTPVYLATNKNPANEHPFFGVLDEVMLYDVALSPALIEALARGERPPVP